MTNSTTDTSVEPRVRADLAARYVEVRRFTEQLAQPLGPEDQTIQSMPDVSPTKWHRAHTTWFFEVFVLGQHVPDHRAYDPTFEYLFNSYYDAVGEQFPRARRGTISRPGVGEITAYRSVVDDAMLALLATPLDDDLAALIDLGLHHEQQHQELLLMDIKHVLAVNPMRPVYRPRPDGDPTTHPSAPTTSVAGAGWIEHDGGLVDVGHSGHRFAYDNETPAHRVWLEPFAVADRLVTCAEWLAFIEDGGYQRPELWLSDGWTAATGAGWTSPLYWQRTAAGDWERFALAGWGPLVPSEPVCHVSHYEADAFARWAGARLPTEAEWEAVARADLAATPAASTPTSLQPAPARPGDRQWMGDVWQWTASAYLGYPGFEPAAGAVGEYNGKFMSNQMVLRGGACITPPGHSRVTYRNFFPPPARWCFGGVRLAVSR